MSYQIFVFGCHGERITLAFSEEEFRSLTVRDLKRKSLQTWPDLEYNKIYLMFAGTKLDDDKLIADYGIQNCSVVHLLLRMAGGGGPDPEEGTMGDRDHKNLSMDRLNDFQDPPLKPKK